MRDCRKFNYDVFFQEHPDLKESNVEVWIDEDNAIEILKLLFEKDGNGDYIRQEKFKNAFKTMHSFRYEKDLYSKENVSDKAKDVTAIKFKRHRGHNWRIYCKEFSVDGKKIVMISSVDKDDKK